MMKKLGFSFITQKESINMNEVALQKMLDVMLVNEFPDIKEIIVRPTKWSDNYSVHIGLSPEGMGKYGPENVRDYIKYISKYMLISGEEVFVIFFNPNN